MIWKETYDAVVVDSSCLCGDNMKMSLLKNFFSFFAKGDLCGLLIDTFANSLDTDQDRQNVGSDLDTNCFTLLIVFLKEFFKKVDFEKKSEQTKTKA